MPNYPGPYEIEFTVVGFTSPTREHKVRMNVAAIGTPAPGTLPASITIQKAGGGTGTLAAVADQAWSFLRQFWPSSITCIGYQFWKYVPGTYGKDFISTGTVTNPAGTGGGVTIKHQLTLTFRSANGGILKTVLLETALGGDTQTALVPNGAGNAAQKWAAYMLSADGVALAADDGYPILALRDSRGENERIFRKIYRGT